MIIRLDDSERLDDLQLKNYKIIQKKDGFCFGMDAVLLSGFARVREDQKVIDLGSGTGIIPILLEAKTKAKHLTGLEIQQDMVEVSRRSVKYNSLESKIEIVHGDIKEAGQIFGLASFDVVTSNPPYMNNHHGLKNPQEGKAIARHEILCCLEDVIISASQLLKVGGGFYMIHRPHRLIEIIKVLTKYKLEPKRIKMVHPFVHKEANMVLIEAIKGGRSMVKIEEPLIVYERQGIYTEDLLKRYGLK